MNLLTQEIEKVIYLDCDIIVNLDINELWQIEIKDYPLAAVTEVSNGVAIAKFSRLVRDGFAKAEDYFNSGVLLMNLKVLREEEENISAGIKFRSEHPEWNLFDQEILNYCFETRTLKLPVKFNRLVKQMRLDGLLSVGKEIYHYAYMKIALTSNMNDPFNHLWMSYFIKTPWFGDDIATDAIGNYLPPQKNYSVSVIIPMYNAEKYIGECLDSLLAQTFQNFEAIVVDDCSSDNSFAIVESYAPKFNGRLKLSKTEKNSGGGGVPRNKGLLISCSCGEYIQFLDADDMLTKTALAEMYTLAKDNDADVVHCERYYTSDDDGSNLRIKFQQKGKLIDKPTFEAQDLKERVQRIIDEKFSGMICNKFVSRNLITENEIFLPNTKTSEDNIWTQGLIFYAKKFLRVPNVVYIYRQSIGSSQRLERTPQEKITFWLNPVLFGLKALDDLMNRHDFFLANPSCRYAVLKNFIDVRYDIILKYAVSLGGGDVYSLIKDEFGEKLGEYAVLISALSTSLCDALHDGKKDPDNDYLLREFFYYLMSETVPQHFTARIDIKLVPKGEGDFKIVSVSDDKAAVKKPDWFNKNGIGYIIQSYAGKLEFLAKATVEGQLSFRLKGISVYNPKDKTKRIPHWIGYTKFAVNEEVLFDKITPAWHDKIYGYNISVKAGDEIKVQVEWLPHRSDVPEVAPPPPKKIVEPVDKKFLPYLTARLDVKLAKTAGDFQIVSVSDEQAKISKPTWLNKGGVGYVIQSYSGSMDVVAKATANGQLRLNLRGMDMRDPEDKTKRIPYWIDYTKLTVNGKAIFDKLTLAWHDKPYKFTLNVKAGEEIKIETEWLPHRSDT